MKDAKTSARSLDALSSELWDVKAVTVNDGSRDVATLLLVEEGTALRVIAKLDVQGRNWVLLTGNAGTRHEEHWGGMFRVEVKAGSQVGPIATRFDAARSQSEASKALGDVRPFAMIAMPDGTSDGIVLMSLTEFAELLALIS